MPIRTNRGRAAVYRRLWGWPLRSPKHLTVAIVVLAVLITAVGIVLPRVVGDSGNGAGGPSAAEPSSAPGSGTSSERPGPIQSAQPTRLTTPLKLPTAAPPNPEALQVAKDWATAWVNHPAGITNEAWLQGLAPYTTEEYLPQMSSVDLANLPATKLTGEPVAKNSLVSSLDVEIATDGPKLSIKVVRTNAGWRVASYDEAS
ncbi:hypothetical protein [Amycolatopsis nigrescens]|uniref:hypothetical protein n=1 Tax=Amycolatopsis nigrescens TaxID=381445 RepID=UPI000371BEBD|nr:hypothetical protein [Amycolatopsis nigrescens]